MYFEFPDIVHYTETLEDESKKPLDPQEVQRAIRKAIPISKFDQAMENARGFHQYYEGHLSSECLTRLQR
tara:strand:+ start:670 stop:879 length:210 start_codon:yes stop_codon:yes gene_type:complete